MCYGWTEITSSGCRRIYDRRQLKAYEKRFKIVITCCSRSWFAIKVLSKPEATSINTQVYVLRHHPGVEHGLNPLAVRPDLDPGPLDSGGWTGRQTSPIKSLPLREKSLGCQTIDREPECAVVSQPRPSWPRRRSAATPPPAALTGSAGASLSTRSPTCVAGGR